MYYATLSGNPVSYEAGFAFLLNLLRYRRMDLVLQMLSNILIPGCLFALIAAGFSFVYSVTRILHLAHGGLVILAGYLFYWAYRIQHLPVWACCMIAVMGTVMVGIAMNALIYERMRTRAAVSTAGALIATLSLLLIVQNGVLARFGSDTKSFSQLSGALHEVGPVVLSDHEIRMLSISCACLLAFIIFLRYTKIGKAIRAVADHETVAEVVGISSRRIRMLAFVLGSMLAAIAGILFAIEYNLEPSMSTMVAARMFFRAIIGGVGSIIGAVIGSLLVETVVALTGWYWNVGWIDVTSFLFTFVVLLIRPAGLFGAKKRSV